MSRFSAASAKAAGALPKSKAAAPAPTANIAVAAKKAVAKPVTLDEKKAYVKKHEHKIEDKQEECKNETNRAAKKTLESEVKKFQQDELYLSILAEIKEAEAQAVRDMERASLTAKSNSKQASPLAESEASAPAIGRKESEQSVIDEKALAEVDAALAATGKDAAVAKATALATLQSFAAATPFVLPRFEKMIGLFADNKLGAPAIKAAHAIVNGIQPKGHGVASVIVPALLKGIENKQWKVKAGCIELLLPCLQQMETNTPFQLASCLPLIVPKLAEAALEVRAEIRTATGAVLRQIGSLVASPEIKKLSQDLVTALAEPTNQKHTQDVLAKMANQTFLSLIDAASLALLMPVVIRGLKERDSVSKKWSAQIFGSIAMLVKDIETLRPYLTSVVSLMQVALNDPVPEVVREAAKAFGTLEQVLPEFSQGHTQPWLFKQLSNGEVGEQMAASLALAEVFLKMNGAQVERFIPEILLGATSDKNNVRKGFLELLDAMPQAMKMDFVPYIDRLFPAMLRGITGEKDLNEDVGFRSALSLVQRFGDLCPETLLPSFESIFVACLHGDSPGERARQQVLREKSAGLLGKVAEKILEHKKFGQDLLTTEECSTTETREYLLCLVLLMRSDADPGVKRVTNLTWKTAGGAPKLQKAIMPATEKVLLRWCQGEMGLGAQKFAVAVHDSFVKAGDLDTPNESNLEPAPPYVFAAPVGLGDGDARKIASGQSPVDVSEDQQLLTTRGLCDDNKDHFQSHPKFASLSAEVLAHCNIVAKSVICEGQKQKVAGSEIALNLTAILQIMLHASGTPIDEDLQAAVEIVTKEVMGSSFEAQAGNSADDADTLLRVDNLLLMYGAGHLLLKDTTLEMKKNHRYGIVGQNGAGKTTLMKEIVNHRIIGMPSNLKCVHVDDSKLGEMSKSCLTALEYVVKMANEIGVPNAGKDTLIGVGFEEKMLSEAVSELSTGWRMRLTLAVSMLKHADLVLLDEPTNHLDEESVEWLANYIVSIDQSSVMVISHEPKFLDKVCTDIVAYVDKKLEYSAGGFDAFAAKKGLSKEQIDAMLSGNLSFDTAAVDADSADDSSGPKSAPTKAPAAVAGPPKLSFPIPGPMEGVKSGTKVVLEAKHASFRYSKGKEYLLNDCNLKLSLNSRVAICGRNGCGKSTLMAMLASEMSPSENKDGALGTVERHSNLRLSYMKQDHLNALGPFFDTSSFVYITTRFKDGYDADLQKRLMEPENEDEAERRTVLAKEHGKYGNQVGELVARSKVGNQLMYEVKWAGLDDPKQNTIVPISKLREMGLDKVVIACDERIASKAAGLDLRPLSRREVVRHVEAFGIDEEMCCNRQIRGFSAGQKVRLSLAAMFWTKPHLIAVDEPTNYLDVETVEALAKALGNFRGGILMIEPKTDFVEKICNEKWLIENGDVTVEKLQNNVKRRA